MRILVADDDLDTVESMAILLRQLGHEVLFATEGEAVVTLAREARPHLILLDIGMPGSDGWEIARRVRNDLGQDAVRIVAVTGRGTKEDHQRSRQAGFDAHVTKPVDLALIESLLAQVK